MHCHCGTDNRAPRWIFTDPCKSEVRPGAREESASPAWLSAPAMNARDTTIIIISFATMTIKGKERYRGVFEIQKSGDKTSSGEIGLYIRTNASPKVGQDQVSGGVSVLCWHDAQVKTRGNLAHWGPSGTVIMSYFIGRCNIVNLISKVLKESIISIGWSFLLSFPEVGNIKEFTVELVSFEEYCKGENIRGGFNF